MRPNAVHRLPLALGAALLLLPLAAGRPAAGARPPGPEGGSAVARPARETFSVVYTVEISLRTPGVARIRWDLAGADEIERIRLAFDPERFDGFAASGTLERRPEEILWVPGAPYGHLTYTAVLSHRRAPGKGYDAFAGDAWVVGRTRGLFPRCSVLFRGDVEAAPESRARLVFRLPEGWEVAAAMPPDGGRGFLVESPRRRFDHPWGWLAIGHFDRTTATAAGTMLTIAAAPGVSLRPEEVVRMLSQALPSLRALFGRTPPRLLVVMAPDPMWRGGLSGEESFYMHGDRPLRTPDKSSPYLHELFHVTAPFRPGADAHWVTEGLAEYYSVEIQRRIGLLDQRAHGRALDLFARHGVWGHDFTRTPAPALRNNSAPLLMYVLDRRIREATAGARGLDDVVERLAWEGGTVSTARFLGSIERTTGKSFGAFFRRHVYRGEYPPLDNPAP